MSEGINVAQIAEIRVEVQKILQLISQVEPKSKRLAKELRNELDILTASMALSQRMFGTSEYGLIMSRIQRIVAATLLMVRTYQMALAATGWGIPLAIISAIGTTITMGEAVGSYG